MKQFDGMKQRKDLRLECCLTLSQRRWSLGRHEGWEFDFRVELHRLRLRLRVKRMDIYVPAHLKPLA